MVVQGRLKNMLPQIRSRKDTHRRMWKLYCFEVLLCFAQYNLVGRVLAPVGRGGYHPPVFCIFQFMRAVRLTERAVILK